MSKYNLIKLSTGFKPNLEKIVFRSYFPGNQDRWKNVTEKIQSLSIEEAKELLQETLKSSKYGEDIIKNVFKKNYLNYIGMDMDHYSFNIEKEYKYLIGAFFTKKFSVESAGLFNPSIVLHPDQTNLEKGSVRILISLRAVGEGHISSLEFKTGILNKDLEIILDKEYNLLYTPEVFDQVRLIEKDEIINIFNSLGIYFPFIKIMIENIQKEDQKIDLNFFRSSLLHINFMETHVNLWELKDPSWDLNIKKCIDLIDILLFDYELKFKKELKDSQKVIVPFNKINQNGIEDVRFVEFKYDEEKIYYATYTAYDGKHIYSQLIKTKDFCSFQFISLLGNNIQNKGMALFPKKINNQYVMISRQDGENIFIMFSNNIRIWNNCELKEIKIPLTSWNIMQLGNCGSPVEIDEGWLLLIHGVGIVRKYFIGAVLLDKQDPTKVLKFSKEPLIKPLKNKRLGYVPDVVYTCGIIKHNNYIIIPFANLDYETHIAKISISDLLQNMDYV